MRDLVRACVLLPALLMTMVSVAENRHVLVIVLDGLRPDYVTEDMMPNLHAMAQEGVWFEDHHSVFPTVTRVNSTSISTGSYPKTHGIMGNTIYIPEVDERRGLSTSDVNNLLEVERVTNGGLLTATTMGEILDANGREMLAVSSGSSGSAFLLNSKVKGLGVRNVGVILPESSREGLLERLGPIPPDGEPSVGRNAWVVEAFLENVTADSTPDLTLMWLTDPDHTAHGAGVGSPATIASLVMVDQNIGQIRAGLEVRGKSEAFDIIVTTDHGFTTNIGGASVTEVLREAGLADEAVVVGEAIYLINETPELVKKVVAALQKEPSFGAIFTNAIEPGSPLGWVPGTFSTSAIHWEHDRSAPIVVTRQWNDDVNKYGYPGSVFSDGVAGHGSLSPYDVHGTMIAIGKSFRTKYDAMLPTSNVDIAPTVLSILGLEPASAMDGRILTEALASSSNDPLSVERVSISTDIPGYSAVLRRSMVGDSVYVDSAKVTRN